MVFRNPYGFLIKHFKSIHLILTGMYIYLTMYVNSILSYYNDFISGTVGKLEANKYINSNYMIVVVLSIIICAIVYALLRYKKKPRVLYVVLSFFVIFVSIMVNVVQGGLEVIYFEVLDMKTLRLYRDMLRILVVFQYISIGFVLVRGLGFDIKKFNFVADLQELNLEVSDEEEIELTFGGANFLHRKFNRRFREFRYYYLENRLFINIILIMLIGLGLGSFILKKEVIDKVYEQGEMFSTGQFNLQVLDSFVTARSYDNEVIVKDNKSLLIVKMNVSSNGVKSVLNIANMLLEVNNNSYVSTSYYGSSFVDLGTIYRGQEIGGTSTYLFVYKIDSNDVSKKMQIVYANDKIVNLEPIMLDEVGEEKNYNLGEKVDFSDSVLENSNLVIDSFEIEDKFFYPYQYEIGGEIFKSQYSITSTQGVIMKLKISSNYSRDFDNYSFFNTYASLRYVFDGDEYETKAFDNKTPGNEIESLYLAVDKNIALAEEIWFDIQIRNYRYIYRLK